MSNRPTFYFQNDKAKPIRAGGLILYNYDKIIKELKFLMVEFKNIYEDFGGKTDEKDIDELETIIREVDEESNKILDVGELLNKLKNQNGLYNKKGKYLLYIIETKIDYNPKDFGQIEFSQNRKRTVKWMTVNQIKNLIEDKKLHIRLNFKDFFDKINELENYYTFFSHEIIKQDYLISSISKKKRNFCVLL
jgi:hypothetical protein